ncbi:ribbon-helix-helix protein, CopG family [Gloeobacter violaceus]|uniref:ribbon-helix-helix protein, CopG family n=1 Tax=Gloeobacter violaceus TaxID=33072 RepID=UPI0013E8E01A|nr:ribbon-helix-helix protein, CopG family [Gloeobacter violaceus]
MDETATPKNTRIIVYLRPPEAELLKELQKKTKVSQSNLMRIALLLFAKQFAEQGSALVESLELDP